MKDLIDRQAAIRSVNTALFPKINTAKDAEKALRDLPSAQPEPQWIPVSERLPETEEFVLASLTGKHRNITFKHACEIADYADGEWCVYAYPHMSAEKCAELIEAWMPLPEEYKQNKQRRTNNKHDSINTRTHRTRNALRSHRQGGKESTAGIR